MTDELDTFLAKRGRDAALAKAETHRLKAVKSFAELGAHLREFGEYLEQAKHHANAAFPVRSDNGNSNEDEVLR
jgi:hypothetical protein